MLRSILTNAARCKRFAAGTGSVAVHGAGSTLAGLATALLSFRATSPP